MYITKYQYMKCSHCKKLEKNEFFLRHHYIFIQTAIYCKKLLAPAPYLRRKLLIAFACSTLLFECSWPHALQCG